jgi:hypothetical protein
MLGSKAARRQSATYQHHTPPSRNKPASREANLHLTTINNRPTATAGIHGGKSGTAAINENKITPAEKTRQYPTGEYKKTTITDGE